MLGISDAGYTPLDTHQQRQYPVNFSTPVGSNNCNPGEYHKNLPPLPPVQAANPIRGDIENGLVQLPESRTAESLGRASTACDPSCTSASHCSQRPLSIDRCCVHNFSHQVYPSRTSLFEPESDWIPAENVFCPGAAPLILPALERLIADTPGIKFNERNLETLSRQELDTWKKFNQVQKSELTTKFLNVSNKNRYWLGHNLEPCVNQSKSPVFKTSATPNLKFLPMHLLDSTILKPLESVIGSIENPSLALLNLLPFNLTSSHPRRIFVSPSSSNHIFSILAQWENFRDLLQISSLIIGFYSSAASSSHSSILLSKNILFHRAFDSYNHDGNGVFYQSFKNYSLLIFRWIPGVFSFDLTEIFGYSSTLLIVYLSIVSIILCEYYFLTGGWIGPRKTGTMTTKFKSSSTHHIQGVCEGHENPKFRTTDDEAHVRGTNLMKFRHTNWYCLTVTLLMLSLYVPVTRICMETLVWSNNLWPIENFYIKNFDKDINLENEIGNLTAERLDWLKKPVEFCYATTIKSNSFDFKVLIMLQSLLLLFLFSFWFPLRFTKTFSMLVSFRKHQQSPNANKTRSVANIEWRNIPAHLERFSFFFHGYKNDDRVVKIMFIHRFFIKFVLIFIQTIPMKDNCLFIRKFSISRYSIDLTRALLLFLIVSSVVILYSFLKPYRFTFLNVMNNLHVRFFLLLSVAGLGSIFIHFKEHLLSSIILSLTSILYCLNFSYVLIHTPIIRTLLSKLNREIEVDENLFSPDFIFQNEVIRRVWHEGISTLILGMPEYRIPEGKTLQWSEEVPGNPYLLDFSGTHGERLVENFKLFEAIGSMEYQKASQISLRRDQESQKDLRLQKTISTEFVGPDCFWKPPQFEDLEGVTTFFGRSDVVPFPFKVIFKYDQYHSPLCISRTEDLRLFVAQNQTPEVVMRRQVRLVLRAIDNREVFAPITIPWHVVKPQSWWLPWTQKSRSPITFRTALLQINRNCQSTWRGYNHNSGFEVSMKYKDGQSIQFDGTTINQISYKRSARSIGLENDFKVTPTLNKLFQENHLIINTAIEKIRISLESHRSYFSNEAIAKENKMSFSFMEAFFQGQDSQNTPLLRKFKSHLELHEVDEKLRSIPQACRGSLMVMEQRMEKINQSKLNQWWFVVFDDIYRRNQKIINALSNQPEDFSPYYPSSICYRPMGRTELEKFLSERNLLRSIPQTDDTGAKGVKVERKFVKPSHSIFHSGFLNSIYLHLDLFLFKEIDEERLAVDDDSNLETKTKTYNYLGNGLPRSKLYQAVYVKSRLNNLESEEADSWKSDFLTKLKNQFKKCFSFGKLSEGFKYQHLENNDEKDDEYEGELRAKTKKTIKKWIKLSHQQNFIKWDTLPQGNFNVSQVSKDHHVESNNITHTPIIPDPLDYSHDNVDVRALKTDNDDTTDEISINTQRGSGKTSPTIYGFC